MRYFLALIAFLFVVPVFAQDQGLYEPVPPPGSGFVRFINTAQEPRGVFSNNKRYAEAPALSVTPYYVVKEGTVDLSAGDIVTQHTVKAGKFYTYINGEYPHVVEDEPNTDASKAQVVFYNIASPKTLSLKTADGKTEVIKSISNGSGKSRLINAVKAKFAIYEGDTKVRDMPEITLQRKESYSAIFMPGMVEPIWVKATTDTKQ